MKFTDTYTLNNGVEIPRLGFGTWQALDQTAVDSVKAAIAAGYRLIDTAAIYGNEVGVGQGIRESGVPREELFITSKVWNAERGYETTLAAFEKTCADLGVDYLDLYLIHWPADAHLIDNWEEENLETWRAMTELYKAGKIRAIGVSNFWPNHLEALLKTEVIPMVNQLEFHPGYMQPEAVAFSKEHGIQVEAWSPFGTGTMFRSEVLEKMAESYGKTVAQIILRWCLQHEILPIPKTVTPSRMAENADIFDFELSAEDMAIIDKIPSYGESGLYPDKNEF